MHDDDSAVGLLCKNNVGEQWIAFGDKQLFMPANGELVPTLFSAVRPETDTLQELIELEREYIGGCYRFKTDLTNSVYTVQASVDEVFKYFKNPTDPKDGTSPKQIDMNSDFAALNLIPIPMLASRSEGKDWVNAMMNNSVPLWIPDKNEPSKTQPWSYRGRIDNHAAYTFDSGRPGFLDETSNSYDVTPEALKVAAASFGGDNQFPLTKTVEAGAGLLQLQQVSGSWLKDSLKPSSTDFRVDAICWTPIRFPIIKYANIPRSITVRNRAKLSNLTFAQTALQTYVVHCLGWYESSTSFTWAVVMTQSNMDTSDPEPVNLQATAVTFVDPESKNSNRFDFTPGTKQASIDPKMVWKKNIFGENPNVPVNMMDLRCISFADSSLSTPFLVSVICGDSTVLGAKTNVTDGSNMWSETISVDAWNKKSPADPEWPIRPFVKAWRDDSKQRVVQFCQHSDTVNNLFNYRVSGLLLTDQQGNPTSAWQQNYLQGTLPLRCPSSGSYNKVRSSCFLVSRPCHHDHPSLRIQI